MSSVATTPFGAIAKEASQGISTEHIKDIKSEFIDADGTAYAKAVSGSSGKLKISMRLDEYPLTETQSVSGTLSISISGTVSTSTGGEANKQLTPDSYTIESALLTYAENGQTSMTAQMEGYSIPVNEDEGSIEIKAAESSMEIISLSVKVNPLKGSGSITISKNGVSAAVDMETASSAIPDSDMKYSGGMGTQASPYILASSDDLDELSDYLLTGSPEFLHYRLAADILLDGNWEMIGKVNRSASESDGAFIGVFDGAGHSVSGLNINTAGEEDVGYAFISGITGAETVVKNLAVSGTVNLSSAGEGALVVCFISDGASVIGCTSGADGDDSSVKAPTAGGIASRILSSGSIEDCTNYADISGMETAGDKVGGIVSTAYKPDGRKMTISGCTNYGTITGDRYTGGILGFGVTADVSDSHNYGEIHAAINAGGVIGQAGTDSTVISCSNHGNIFVKQGIDNTGNIGGVVGYALSATCLIDDCHNYAPISHSGNASQIQSIGGILGYSESGTTTTMTGCTNDAKGTLAGFPDDSRSIGGILGSSAGSMIMKECVNNADISGGSYCGGIAGSLNVSSGTVSDCHNYGDIQGAAGYNGGITAFFRSGEISSCTNEGNVTVEDSNGGSAGGIVGAFDGARTVSISGCVNGVEGNSSKGAIKANQHAGGITGGAIGYGSSITESVNYGNISGCAFVGGISAQIGNGTTIDGCTNYGTLASTTEKTSGGSEIGGIVGRVYAADIKDQNGDVLDAAATATIMNSVNNGDITVERSEAYVGGIAGTVYNLSEINNADANSTITLGNTSAGTLRIGGIVGNTSIATDAFQTGKMNITFTDCDFTGSLPDGYESVAGKANENGGIMEFTNCTVNGVIVNPLEG